MTDEKLSISDTTLIARLRSQLGDDVQHVYDHEALFRLSADRIEALVKARREDALELLAAHGQAQDAYEAQLKAEARAERLEAVMKVLEKAAAEVSRRGAETGPQWTKLNVALLQARAELAQEGRTDE